MEYFWVNTWEQDILHKGKTMPTGELCAHGEGRLKVYVITGLKICSGGGGLNV